MRDGIMELVDRKVCEDNLAKEKAHMIEQEKAQKAMEDCKALTGRIEDLIEAANYIISKGFELPHSTWDRFREFDAYANGITHRVGFARHKADMPINGMAIYAGGACGPWDFMVRNGEFYLRHEDTGEIKQPGSEMLKRFLNGFSWFEESFYKWIEDRMK